MNFSRTRLDNWQYACAGMRFLAILFAVWGLSGFQIYYLEYAIFFCALVIGMDRAFAFVFKLLGWGK